MPESDKIYTAEELIRKAWAEIDYEDEHNIPTIVDRAEEAYRRMIEEQDKKT